MEPDFVTKYLIFEQLENDSITELLLSTAITLRVLDDREKGSLDCFSRYCGLLQEESKNPPESKCLTIREACNKIVHATEIELARDNISPDLNSLFPENSLFGTSQSKKKWTATINIYEYVREGMFGIGGIK